MGRYRYRYILKNELKQNKNLLLNMGISYANTANNLEL